MLPLLPLEFARGIDQIQNTYFGKGDLMDEAGNASLGISVDITNRCMPHGGMITQGRFLLLVC